MWLDFRPSKRQLVVITTRLVNQYQNIPIDRQERRRIAFEAAERQILMLKQLAIASKDSPLEQRAEEIYVRLYDLQRENDRQTEVAIGGHPDRVNSPENGDCEVGRGKMVRPTSPRTTRNSHKKEPRKHVISPKKNSRN